MLNKVMLIGRLGADPEVRYMPSGDQITTIRLATTRRWKDRTTNERKEETEWHRVVFFGSLAKVAGEYLKKGGQIYAEGRIRTQKWQDQSGVDRFTTEIVADTMNMLDSKPHGEEYKSTGGSPSEPQRRSPSEAGHNYDYSDDDIPF